MRTLSVLSIAFLLACGDKEEDTSTETDTDTDTDSDTDTDTDADADTDVSADAPVIETGDAWCFTPGGSVEGDMWAFIFTYSDPQGNDTVPRLQQGAISVRNAAGAAIATFDPACDQTLAECSTYPPTTQVNVGCDAATSHTIQYQMVDDDGNMSNTLELTGRQGTDFEG